MLSTKNLPLPASLSRKLAVKWIGPLSVVAKFGHVAYKIELPSALSRLHDVFHVSLLKPFLGVAPVVSDPVFIVDAVPEYEVECIINHRYVKGQF